MHFHNIRQVYLRIVRKECFLTFATMQLFYVPKIEGEFAYFDEVEARHCVQVLRKKAGDTVHFVDGRGGFYEGIIEETAKKNCVAKIVDTKPDGQTRSYKLHIAIAPTKNIARLEWFLEKATEIGIDSITPIVCDHSERTKLRLDRLEKVVVAAMKQSLKATLPTVNALTRFKDFLATVNASQAQLFIAHCEESDKISLQANYQKGKNVIILIGPEGDFSTSEIHLANEHGFRSITLGNSRLRTETAGVVAVNLIQFLNNEG